MISFDRETLTIVAIIACIAATVYMYKEFTKAKSDIESIKGFCNRIVQAHTPPPNQHHVIQEHDEEEEEEEEEVPIKNVAESKEN
jgi:hypothetical protein